MPLPIILWGLAAAASAYAGKKGYDYYSESREEKEKNERKQKEQDHEAKIVQSKEEALNFENTWGERLNSLVLVDSNIWMQIDYDRFFTELEWVMKKNSSTIKMSSVQFDEIINLKNLPYENPKSRLARCALNRIEYFQNIDLLEIIPMNFEAKKNAYADPDIIKILLDSSSKHSVMTLVTDDRELRIRTNQIIKDKSQSNFLSITGKDLQELIYQYHNNLDVIS